MHMPERVPFAMMGGTNRGNRGGARNYNDGASRSDSPPNNVEFSVHQPSYGRAPGPNMHTHDGVSFHSSHDEPRGGHSHEAGNHGHTHEDLDHPGLYHERDTPLIRDWKERAFTIGIGG